MLYEIWRGTRISYFLSVGRRLDAPRRLIRDAQIGARNARPALARVARCNTDNCGHHPILKSAIRHESQ